MSSTRRTSFLLILALVAAIQAWSPGPAGAITLTQVDGGPNYYARFSRALPADRSYFPIGVWFESVLSQANVNQDKDAGLNLYVVLTANSNVSLAQANGMKTILQGDEFGSNTQTQGWFLADEVDMTQGPGAGYSQMQGIAAGLPRDGTIRYANYGKGVTFWESDAEAARFVNDYQDVVSADNYWFTDDNICSGTEGGSLVGGGAPLSPAQCHRAANYGATVGRVRSLIRPAGSKPVWAIVELGHPASEADWPTIKPAAGPRGRLAEPDRRGTGNRLLQPQLRRARPDAAHPPGRGQPELGVRTDPVRGHRHEPRDRGAGPGAQLTDGELRLVPGGRHDRDGQVGDRQDDRQGQVQVQEEQEEVQEEGEGHDRQGQEEVQVQEGEVQEEERERRLYVFAGSAGGQVEGRFKVPCVGDTRASVVDENRTVPVRNGSFSDNFADGNAIHIYRIDLGSRCGSPRLAAAPPAPPPVAAAPPPRRKESPG